jgi:glutamate carboxypeptidase
MNDESGRLLETAREAGRALGMVVEAEASAAAGSTAFAGANGVPTIDGMGPSGGDLMTHDEHIALDSLVPRAALLAVSLASLATRR